MKPLDPQIFKEYESLKKDLQASILKDKESRKNFLSLYKKFKEEGQSLSKLSAGFNAKKPGWNQKLSKKVEKEIDAKTFKFQISLKVLRSLAENKAKEIDNRLREIEKEILSAYMPLALSVAKKHSSNIFGIDLNDSIQEANKGVLEAIENFDYRKSQFSTYAYIYARKKVRDWIMEQSRLVRLPRNKLVVVFALLETANKTHIRDVTSLTKEVNKLLEKKKRRTLVESEILSEDEIQEAITLLNGNTVSLDKKNTFTYEENSRPKTIGDFLQSPEKTPEEILSAKDNRNQLIGVLMGSLTDLEYFIIENKFFNQQEMSLKDLQEEIKKVKGRTLSRERINQIKKEALKKLRNIPELRGLLNANF